MIKQHGSRPTGIVLLYFQVHASGFILLCFNSRFKRGGKNLKGGPDRIGLGFEEPNSKSSKMGSQDPLPEYLTSNSSITTRTDTTGKIC